MASERASNRETETPPTSEALLPDADPSTAARRLLQSVTAASEDARKLLQQVGGAWCWLLWVGGRGRGARPPAHPPT